MGPETATDSRRSVALLGAHPPVHTRQRLLKVDRALRRAARLLWKSSPALDPVRKFKNTIGTA